MSRWSAFYLALTLAGLVGIYLAGAEYRKKRLDMHKAYELCLVQAKESRLVPNSYIQTECFERIYRRGQTKTRD